jgi:hypothetical protein
MAWRNEHGSAWERQKTEKFNNDGGAIAGEVAADAATGGLSELFFGIERLIKKHKAKHKFSNDAGSQSAANNIAGQIKALIDAAGVLNYTDLGSSDMAKYNTLVNQLMRMGYTYDPANGDGIAAMAGNTGRGANTSYSLLSDLESLF